MKGSYSIDSRNSRRRLTGQLGFHPFLQDMKVQRVSLWLLGAMLILCSVHTRSLRRCPISVDMRHLEESFQEIKKAIVSMVG